MICRLVISLIVLLLLATPSLACAGNEGPPPITVKLVPDAPLVPGEEVGVTLTLRHAASGKPVTLADLKEVHTSKLHLLIIDPSLTDYHHIHPVAGNMPGEYRFRFTPQENHYRVWADVTMAKSGRHSYVDADMGDGAAIASIEKTQRLSTTVDGYDFTLSFEDPLRKGEAAMANLTVSKEGKPFTKLEPVMGAYAHLVGFGEDFDSILHIHPLGEEPKTASDRGGPALMFHLEPQEAGFVKLFAQVRIDGKDLFAPFGVMVK